MSNERRDFFLRVVIGFILLLTAIYFQINNGEVPQWIMTALVGFLAFALGLGANNPINRQ